MKITNETIEDGEAYVAITFYFGGESQPSSLTGLVLWIILMIQAGTGKMWKLPWAGDWAEKQASKAS